MLRITLHEKPGCVRFQLEGRLIGAWVREFERVWFAGSAGHERDRKIVDLTDVTFVDGVGQELLARLSSLGAQLLAAGPMTSSIVERITHAAHTA